MPLNFFIQKFHRLHAYNRISFTMFADLPGLPGFSLQYSTLILLEEGMNIVNENKELETMKV